MKYWEDFQVGERAELGRHTFSEDEILEFGRRYDPQPFHVDVENARQNAFGGLIASGWHTMAIFMRLYVDAILLDSASLGSPGVEELRWLKPVRPGDTLTGRSRVLWTKPSERDPGRGTVFSESELVNQDGEVVMRLRARGLFGRRPA